MPRARSFDIDQALDAAVGLLWRQGYAATSVRQLCEAMGLQPGSFYAAFESKDACFRRALVRYVEVQLPRLEARPEAVAAWLWAISSSARRGQGCLLVNSAVEWPSLDEDSRTSVKKHLRALEGFFARCLCERPSGKEDAEFLAATVVAIHVMARGGASPAKLRRVATRALILTNIDIP